MILNIPTLLPKKGAYLKNPAPVFKYIHKQVSRLWRDATKAFLEAAIRLISVDTGMTAAQFLPLGIEIRRKGVVDSFIARRRRIRVGYTDPDGAWVKYGWKSPSTGELYGEKGVGYELEFGTPQNPEFTFVFRAVVYQYQFHERTWGSLDAGADAFINFLNQNYTNYISGNTITNWLLTGDIGVLTV